MLQAITEGVCMEDLIFWIVYLSNTYYIIFGDKFKCHSLNKQVIRVEGL